MKKKKRNQLKKTDTEIYEEEKVTAKNEINGIVMRLDDFRRELLQAQELGRAVKLAALLRDLKPIVEQISVIVPCPEAYQPPVIHPNEEKLAIIQKTGVAVIKDCRNILVNVQKELETVDKILWKTLIDLISKCNSNVQKFQ